LEMAAPERLQLPRTEQLAAVKIIITFSNVKEII
jgi:hypothetical protein